MKSHLNRTVISVLGAEIALYFTINNKELRFLLWTIQQIVGTQNPSRGHQNVWQEE